MERWELSVRTKVFVIQMLCSTGSCITTFSAAMALLTECVNLRCTDGLSRVGLTDRGPISSSQLAALSSGDTSYAELLYRRQQQLMAAGVGNGGSSNNEHKPRTESRQARDSEHGSSGGHDRHRDSDSRHNSSSEHGSLAR